MGRQDIRTLGHQVRSKLGLQVTGTMPHRGNGTPGQWDTGTMGHRNNWTAGQWDSGTMEHRDNGTPEQWDTGTMGGFGVPTYRNCVVTFYCVNISIAIWKRAKLALLKRVKVGLWASGKQ